MTTFDAAKARCPIHGNEWCTCVQETDPSVAQINEGAIKIIFNHEANCAVHSPTLRPCSCGLETRMRDEILRLRSDAEKQIWNRVEQATDSEAKRWQDAIDVVVLEFDPDRDGSGCDSGDPLDLTLSEVRTAFNRMQESHDKARAAQSAEIGRLSKVVESLPKTADGVPITHSMRVWPLELDDYTDDDGTIDEDNGATVIGIRLDDHGEYFEITLRDSRGEKGPHHLEALPSDLYSTREAALLSKKEML